MRSYRYLIAAAFVAAACGEPAEADTASSDLEAQVAQLPTVRGDGKKLKLVRVVLPLYDALNRPATKDVARLLEQATAADWQSCSENDSACATREQVVAGFQDQGRVVPDLSWSIKEVLVDDDHVIVRGEGAGTPVAPFLGLPPSGKAFRVMSIDIHTIKHDKIVKTHHIENWLDAEAQLK